MENKFQINLIGSSFSRYLPGLLVYIFMLEWYTTNPHVRTGNKITYPYTISTAADVSCSECLSVYKVFFSDLSIVVSYYYVKLCLLQIFLLQIMILLQTPFRLS